MALKAAFVGIDKYQDARIRDLTGARRDATALWALFCDTLPRIEAELITDDDATLAAIRRVLDATLGVASPDDTVILFFSGHGTRNHRLVAHDTRRDDILNTTVPMAELAERFRASQARAVLCILDCCFSGGAPARVVEDSPIPRDTDITLDSLAGTGRILIAASNIDEPAYEVPNRRHGILTIGLLQALQSSDATVNITEAMADVMDYVRAEAGRLGVVQTPVLFGYVEGGLALPALRPGERYYAAFPEQRSARVSHALDDLRQFGLPVEVLEEWKRQFPAGLNNLQVQAVNDHGALIGESLLVVAPTSSGKTFIGEMAAVKAVVEGRKAAFLLPYKALTSEKYDQFSRLYGSRLGMRIIRCTGDYLDQTGAFVRGKYDLATLTYEMFLNLVVGNPGALNQIGLVVLDEGQFVTDPGRGITVELLLTYLLTKRQKGIAPQLIVLSAVIGNVNAFDSWLRCRALVTTERPIPLVEGVLDRTGAFQCVDTSGNIQLIQLLPPGAVQVRRDKPSAQDVIVPLARILVEQGEKVIVFRNQKGRAEGCARYLAQDLGLPPAADVIQRLPQHDLPSTSADLRQCLNGGTAFHDTNLTREEKAVVEQAFREADSTVRVLAATTTLAAGINTPASTVILAEQEFIGEDGRPFTVAEYKNMAGRAGRLGFREEGKAIILADTVHEREVLFHKYVLGRLEPFESSFRLENISTWIVRLLAQVDRVPRAEVVGLLTNTYGGYLAAQQNPKWPQELAAHLEKLMGRTIALGLVEVDGEYVRLTLLGRACGRSALSFESAMRLVELMRSIPVSLLTAENLMALLQMMPESDSGYTPMYKRGNAEAARPGQAADRYGSEIVRLLQKFADDHFDYYARCKRAAVLWDWVRGVPIETIEQQYSANPYFSRIGHGDIRKFADNTRFHLRSAAEIVALVYIRDAPDEQEIEVLLRQLEIGLPTDGLDLLSLPVSLSRGECLALYNAGMKTAQSVWASEPATIQGILGQLRAQMLLALRPNGT